MINTHVHPVTYPKFRIGVHEKRDRMRRVHANFGFSQLYFMAVPADLLVPHVQRVILGVQNLPGTQKPDACLVLLVQAASRKNGT